MCNPKNQTVAPAKADPKEKYNKPLPASVTTWVAKGETEPTYGQMHEIIHRDISIGNDYRKERIKLLTALATGVFALTVTFHKELFGASITGIGLILMLTGWAALVISLLAGILHFKNWEDFYLEHRKSGLAVWGHKTAAGDQESRRKAQIEFHKAQEEIDRLREAYRKWNWIQSTGLLVGLILISVYVGLSSYNLIAQHEKPVAKTSSEKGSVPSAAAPSSPQ